MIPRTRPGTRTVRRRRRDRELHQTPLSWSIINCPRTRSPMFIRPIFPCLLALAAGVSCSRDPNVIKARYMQNGNKYFEKGKYKEASIMYRTALQKDAKYGEAYYRLALTEIKTEQPIGAIQSLRRAVELLKPDRKERMDARVKLADLYLDFL